MSGTSSETYTYDGRSRVVTGTDDDSAVTRQYDSLGHLLTETQAAGPGGATRVVSRDVRQPGRRLTLHYPGGRLIAASYDALGRPAGVATSRRERRR